MNDVVRRWYAFALKDPAPLPEGGWTAVRHGPGCLLEGETITSHVDGSCITSEVCRLDPVDGVDAGFMQGLSDLSALVDKFVSPAAGTRPPSFPPADRVIRVAALVGSPWAESMTIGEHYERCFQFLHDAVKALRLASGAQTPNVSIERVWPLYLVIDEDRVGHKHVNQAVIVEHGLLPGARTLSPDQVEVAQHILTATFNRSPVEAYRDYELDARNAAHVQGDYAEAVLKAATAAEILLKTAAWMLTWEASQLPSDPHPQAAQGDSIFEARPAQLISGVLSARLGGNWSSQDSTVAMGAWRTHIARPRNRVIHRGHRPRPLEADEAVLALTALVGHVCDRLASRASSYPRTALILAGRSALEKRGAWGRVRATAAGVNLDNAVHAYAIWLDAKLSDDADLNW